MPVESEVKVVAYLVYSHLGNSNRAVEYLAKNKGASNVHG